MFLHQHLLEWNKAEIDHSVYMSSILIVNNNVPFFEEYFGMLDYDWLVRVTNGRKVKVTDPVVIRYIHKNNLSLTSEYRSRDFYMLLTIIDGKPEKMKKLFGSRARYYYYIGNTRMARFWFKRASFNSKNILYYFTSFLPFLRKWIVKHFRVFGSPLSPTTPQT